MPATKIVEIFFFLLHKTCTKCCIPARCIINPFNYGSMVLLFSLEIKTIFLPESLYVRSSYTQCVQLHFDLKIYFIGLKEKWTLLHKLKINANFNSWFQIENWKTKNKQFFILFCKEYSIRTDYVPFTSQCTESIILIFHFIQKIENQFNFSNSIYDWK